MIVEKAVKMAKLMEIPILGIVENMSYVECPNCAEKISIFGESNIEETAKRAGVEALGRIPMRPDIAANCDKGRVEDINGKEWLEKAIDAVKNTVNS